MYRDLALFVSYWITRGGQYLINLIFFRFVSGADLAAMNLLLPVFGLLSSVLTFGQDRYLMQEVRNAAVPEQLRNSVLSNVTAINLLLLVLIGLPLLWVTDAAVFALWMAAAAYAITQLGAAYDNLRPRIRSLVYSRALPSIWMLLSAGIAVCRPAVVLNFFSLSGAGLLVLLLMRYKSHLKPHFQIPADRVRMCGYFIAMLFSGWLPTFVGRYVLHVASNEGAVNEYSAVTLFYQVLVALSIAYNSTWTYKIIKAGDSCVEVFKRHAIRHVTLFVGVATVLTVLFPLAGPLVFPTVAFHAPIQVGVLCELAFLLYLPYLVTVDFLQINARNRALVITNAMYGTASVITSIATASFGVPAMLVSLAVANAVASVLAILFVSSLLQANQAKGI